MSFDLHAWFEPGPITAAEATRKYDLLREGDATGLVAPGPRMEAFGAALLERFPALESLDDDAFDGSPWAISPEVSDVCISMSIVWSKVTRVLPVIHRLAAEHDLVYYDPQARTVHNSIHRHSSPALRLEMCDGSIIDDPDAQPLRAELDRLSEQNWHAVLEAQPQWYIQVGLGPGAGAPAGRYVLERRDGSTDRHYRHAFADHERVVTAFQDFAAGDRTWFQQLQWHRVDL